MLGTAVLEDVVPTEAIKDQLSYFERLLGNYADGRRAWKLGPVTRYATPVRARGRQGFWEWTAPVKERLEKELADLEAAIGYFVKENGLAIPAITERRHRKYAQFRKRILSGLKG